MNESDFENRVRSVATQMNYPRTPDVAGIILTRLNPSTKPGFFSRSFGAVQGRGVVVSLSLIVVLLFSLMLIPPVRAAVLEFIQIGIVRIFPRSTEAHPIETPLTALPESHAPVTATPYLKSSTLLVDLARLAGERTLSEAKVLVAPYYSILLPAFPPELGEPEHVFVQEANGAMTILVWLDPNDSEKALISLHIIPAGSWAIHKSEPVTIQETLVNGQRAVWAAGPYPLRYSNGDLDFTRLIVGYVLIWTEGDITYRLETALPMDEAIKVAESLEPIP